LEDEMELLMGKLEEKAVMLVKHLESQKKEKMKESHWDAHSDLMMVCEMGMMKRLEAYTESGNEKEKEKEPK
jgi:hypothetical protein